MTDINIAMAFMQYMVDPCAKTVEAVVVALESRSDLPISADQTRKVLMDGIADMRAAKAGTSPAHTSALLQRLMGAGR